MHISSRPPSEGLHPTDDQCLKKIHEAVAHLQTTAARVHKCAIPNDSQSIQGYITKFHQGECGNSDEEGKKLVAQAIESYAQAKDEYLQVVAADEAKGWNTDIQEQIPTWIATTEKKIISLDSYALTPPERRKWYQKVISYIRGLYHRDTIDKLKSRLDLLKETNQIQHSQTLPTLLASRIAEITDLITEVKRREEQQKASVEQQPSAQTQETGETGWLATAWKAKETAWKAKEQVQGAVQSMLQMAGLSTQPPPPPSSTSAPPPSSTSAPPPPPLPPLEELTATKALLEKGETRLNALQPFQQFSKFYLESELAPLATKTDKQAATPVAEQAAAKTDETAEVKQLRATFSEIFPDEEVQKALTHLIPLQGVQAVTEEATDRETTLLTITLDGPYVGTTRKLATETQFAQSTFLVGPKVVLECDKTNKRISFQSGGPTFHSLTMNPDFDRTTRSPDLSFMSKAAAKRLGALAMKGKLTSGFFVLKSIESTKRTPAYPFLLQIRPCDWDEKAGKEEDKGEEKALRACLTKETQALLTPTAAGKVPVPIIEESPQGDTITKTEPRVFEELDHDKKTLLFSWRASELYSTAKEIEADYGALTWSPLPPP